MGAAVLLAALAVGQPDDGDRFRAAGPGDEAPVGRLVRVNADGSTELDSGVVRDVFSLRRVGVPLPPLPRGPVLVTTTGDRVPGRVAGGDGEVLRFLPSGAEQPWNVPLPAVAAVWLTRAPAVTPPDPARYPWLGAAKRDVLRFRNGDTLPGTVSGFADDGKALAFRPDAGDGRTVPLTAVAAVGFNPALASARRPKGAYTHAVFRDGTRLDLAAATVANDTLRGKTMFGLEVEFPLGDVVALDTVRGRATDLAALKVRAEQGGFLGAPWPWAADRTVRGEPLRLLTALGVETFDRGLGTHPRAVLTYELAGKYRRFEAWVGLDPVSGARGRATVRVMVDGKDVTPDALRDLVPGPATAVRVELTGAKQLMLSVDYGPAGDVQADVNWGDARVVE